MTDARITASIFPSLTYRDAPAAIEWLCRVFGFQKRLVVPGPEGTVMHSELSLGNGVVMIGSARPEQGRLDAETLGGVDCTISAYVADPDAHYAHAKAAGAVIRQELKDEEYGARGYMVEDCEGRPWYFATYVPGDHWDAEG